MRNFKTVKGKELTTVKGDKGFAKRWLSGSYTESDFIKAVYHFSNEKVIVEMWEDGGLTATSDDLVVAIQDLATGEWYYRN